MSKGWMYILKCADSSYYTGSTKNLELRIKQHQAGEGANHTKKRLPIKLVYSEEFQRIDEAFYREKQVQGWSRKKKEALINNNEDKLPELSIAYRDVVSRTSTTKPSRTSTTKPSKTSTTKPSRTSTTKPSRTSTTKPSKNATTEIKKLPKLLPKILPELLPELLPEALEDKSNQRR